jgi:hypothetical protein
VFNILVCFSFIFLSLAISFLNPVFAFEMPPIRQGEKGRVAVFVTEKLSDAGEITGGVNDLLNTAAAETIITAELAKRGYTVIDKQSLVARARQQGAMKKNEQLNIQGNIARIGAAGGADLLILGKSAARTNQTPLSGTNMRPSQATVSLKLLELPGGMVVASVDTIGSAAHVNPDSGGLEAIKKAASTAAADLGRKLVSLSKPSYPDVSPKQYTVVSRMETLPPFQPLPVPASVVPPQDLTGPNVTIISPDIHRSLRPVAKTSAVVVSGQVTDESGVASVVVNGQSAALDEKGNFSSEVLLKVGDNSIDLVAMDTRRNITSKKFTIKRDVAQAVVRPAVETQIESPAAGDVGTGVYYALLIAVQDYTNSEINRLDHPLGDAASLKKILTRYYTFDEKNVVMLENPDGKAIGKAFNDLRLKLTERDNLLVFYAGHGVWMEDMKEGFWLPRDSSGPNDPTAWLPNSTVRNYIRAIKAKHVLLVADACFAGGIFKVRDAFSKPNVSIRKIYEMPSRKAITSGALKTVPDKSVFVEYLQKRLAENRDDFLDSQRLFVSFKEAVINNSPNSQTPLYGAINEAGDEGGDFVFVRRKMSP